MGTLGTSPQTAEVPHQHDHACNHQVETVMVVARASRYRAVCSRGDLNAVFSSRAAAVKAAQAHQRATGHAVSVRKQ